MMNSLPNACTVEEIVMIRDGELALQFTCHCYRHPHHHNHHHHLQKRLYHHIQNTIFETTIPILMAVGLLVRFPIYLLTEVGRWTWPWVCLQSKRSIAVCTRRIPLGTDAGVGQVHHHHLHHHHQHQHRHLQQNLLIKIIWSRTPYMADSIRNWWRALNKCTINTNIIIVSITIQGTKSWLKIILLKRQTLIAIVLVTTNSF